MNNQDRKDFQTVIELISSLMEIQTNGESFLAVLNPQIQPSDLIPHLEYIKLLTLYSKFDLEATQRELNIAQQTIQKLKKRG